MVLVVIQLRGWCQCRNRFLVWRYRNMATKEKKEAKAVKAIQLNFQSRQQVVITGTEGDRWVTTVREAAQACRSALDQKSWEEEFRSFLTRINEWAKAYADIVSAAVVGVSCEGLPGVIITQGQDDRT